MARAVGVAAMLCPAAALLVGLLAATNPSAVDAACPQSCMCTVCHAVADSLNFQLIGRVSSHVDEAHAVDHVKHVLDTVCTVLKYDRLLETAPAPCDSCEAADLARMCLSALRADRMEWQGLLVEHVDPSARRARPWAAGWGRFPRTAFTVPPIAPAQGMPSSSGPYPLWNSATGRVASPGGARRRRPDYESRAEASAKRRQRLQELHRARKRHGHDEL